MAPSMVDKIRERAVEQAQSAEKAAFEWENATTNKQKLNVSRDLMNSSMTMIEQYRKYHRQNQRGELINDLTATTPEEQRATIERVLLESVTVADYHRERYNNLVATIQAERQAKRKADRQAKRKVDRERTQKDRTKVFPKPDTTTPFVSLSSFGLKGWARQRPATVPNYTAFDQATRNEPSWMPEVRDRLPESARDSLLPRTFRDIDETPEGMSVQMVIPDIPGAAKMGDLSIDQVTSKDGDSRPNFARMEWRDGVYRLGEEIFASQNTDVDAFWDQTPPPATPWSTSSPRTIQSVVGEYGSEGFEVVNQFLRSGPDREEDVWEGIERDIQYAIQHTNRAMRRRDRMLIQEQIDGLEYTQRQISTLDAGMRPVPRTVMVRRGGGNRTFSRMQQHLQVGDRFTDDCFTSTSLNPTFNWGASPMVNVILTEGTPALWTDGHAMRSIENEVIVGRGVTYEVVSTDNERGWILRTIPPEGRYTPPPVSAYGDNDPLSPEARQFLKER
jgi:hypothetical protein